MIHPTSLDRANNHICDIRFEDRLSVNDSYKKSAHVEQMGSQHADG
jgi:hypothetical protein